MKLVTVETMRAIDKAAIAGDGDNQEPIPSLELMENAGSGVAEAIYEDFFAFAEKKRVVVFCGKGNNGGDGLVIARRLAELGCWVIVYLIGKREELSPDAQTNFDRLSETEVKIQLVADIGDLPDKLVTDLQIDAILGTGTKGAPRGLALDLIKYINRQEIPVCSVDDPSGLDADSGATFGGEAVYADFTYTLALPKSGHYLHPGKAFAGTVRVIPIGLPDQVIDSFKIQENLITPEMVLEKLPPRPGDAHKGAFGRLYLLAGSRGLTGAAAMAAEAAMRSGLGMATLGCPDSLESVFEIKLNEVMTHGLPSVAKRGALSTRALGGVLPALNRANAAIIGPGLGRHRQTEELVRRVVTGAKSPFVLDADGLNAFEKDASVLESDHVPCILTPHPGEFQRLTEAEVPKDFHERLTALRSACSRFRAVIILKGATTLIGEPGGQIYLNPLGNSGMATGGSGDVLSGIVGSLLAQGSSTLNAAISGAYLHSLAGDLAAAEIGERSLIAGDLIDYLPSAFDIIETTMDSETA